MSSLSCSSRLSASRSMSNIHRGISEIDLNKPQAARNAKSPGRSRAVTFHICAQFQLCSLTRRDITPTRHAASSFENRHMPVRSKSQTELASFLYNQQDASFNSSRSAPSSPTTEEINRTRFMRLMRVDAAGKSLQELDEADRILVYSKRQAPHPPVGHLNGKILYSTSAQPSSSSVKKSSSRHIPSTAEKILDAPGFQDDYYTELLHWGENNQVGVILGSEVYYMNAYPGDIGLFYVSPSDAATMTTFRWSGDSRFAAIGDESGLITLFDAASHKELRRLTVPRVSKTTCMAWKDHILSVGYASGQVINHDVRIKSSAVGVLAAHSQPVAGLHYSPDYTQLATGGGDNIVNIWDVRKLTAMNEEPLFSLREHTASVKAVRFCSYRRGVLATGGGTADPTIRFWDTNFGTLVRTIKAKAQVTSIRFNNDYREVIVSTGRPHNALTIFNHASYKEVATISGHTDRVLSMTQSPCGQFVMTGSADETLRMWHVFKVDKSTKKLFDNTSKFSTLRAMR